MPQSTFPTMRYDFSGLSKKRLSTYNMLVNEIERQEQELGARELMDDELDMLAAAGETTKSTTNDELPC